LAACQRHTPSSLAAVIGLSNNDVIALRCVRCVGWKPGIKVTNLASAASAAARRGQPNHQERQTPIGSSLAEGRTPVCGLQTLQRNTTEPKIIENSYCTPSPLSPSLFSLPLSFSFLPLSLPL